VEWDKEKKHLVFTLLYHIEGGRQVESEDDRTCRARERQTSKQKKTKEFHQGVLG
jgi:hypothetical protein